MKIGEFAEWNIRVSEQVAVWLNRYLLFYDNVVKADISSVLCLLR